MTLSIGYLKLSNMALKYCSSYNYCLVPIPSSLKSAHLFATVCNLASVNLKLVRLWYKVVFVFPLYFPNWDIADVNWFKYFWLKVNALNAYLIYHQSGIFHSAWRLVYFNSSILLLFFCLLQPSCKYFPELFFNY